MLTKNVQFRQIVNRPQNLRIIHENAIAGIILFMILVFIEPFGTDELDHSRYFYFAAIVAATTIVGCSAGFFTGYVLKMPLNPSFPLIKIHRNALAILLIHQPITAFVVSAIYGFMYNGYIADVLWNNVQYDGAPYFEHLYYTSMLCTLSYSGAFVRNGTWHLRYQLNSQKKKSIQFEQGQDKERNMIASPEISEEISSIETQMMRFKGNAVHSALDIMPSRIIYVEVNANYVDFCFLDNGQTGNKQLRTTLKQVKEQLGQQPSFVQCHRSYIINLHQVEKLSSEGFCHLQMFGVKKRIPVSRKYESIIKEKITEYLTIDENETVAE